MSLESEESERESVYECMYLRSTADGSQGLRMLDKLLNHQPTLPLHEPECFF